jgi:copper transport protein
MSPAIASILFAAPASGHAVMESSFPRDGEVVEAGRSVTAVVLRFDEPVEVGVGSVRVVAVDGQRVDTGRVYHPESASRNVAVSLRAGLAAGSYLVMWRVVSADSHPVTGSFTFAVGRAGPVAATAALPGPSVPIAAGIARFLGYAGVLLIVGAIGFLLICWPSGWSAPRTRLLICSGIAVSGLASGTGLLLQGAADAGAGLSGVLDESLLQPVLSTRFGQAHLVRVCLLSVVAATVWAVTSERARRPVRWLAGLLVVELAGLVITIAAQGHAATGSWPLARMPLDVAHVAAAGIWLGGLAMLTVVALPVARRAVADPSPEDGPRSGDPWAVIAAVRRFSTLALTCVIVLVVSGLAQAWRQIGELSAITTTHYGQLLLVKVGLLVVILGFAAVSRARVRSNLARAVTSSGPSALARSVRAETALGLGVVAVTAVLVATTPARIAYRPIEERTVTAGPVTVQLTAVPEGGHTIDLHLYVFGANGLPTDVLAMRAEADLPARHLGPISLTLVPAGTGHFIANRVLLPRGGAWTLRLYVRASEFDAYPATTRLTVR